MKILVVDDDPDFIRLIKRRIENQGHEVLTAEDGLKALDIISQNDIRFVITDWIMKEMDGATLCRNIRNTSISGYVYIILMTSRTNKEDIVTGMEAGADDYLTKPFHEGELRTRIKAGVRILDLEHNLTEKNEIIRKDLEAARKLQESFLPAKFPEIENVDFAARFIPSSYVSGDIYNIFRLDEEHIGLYHVDVMGHGVLSALFSVSIHQRMSHDLSPYGLIKTPTGSKPFYKINSPLDVAMELNQSLLIEEYGSYYTMLYAILNTKTGLLTMCRAGHNLPLVLSSDGSFIYIDGGGPPIGLGIPFNSDEEQTYQLTSGDSLIVFSDGINECSPSEEADAEYGLNRVKDVLAGSSNDGLNASFDALISDLYDFRGTDEFSDDVSIIGLRWNKE
ncbi:MAG: SpoIIE family protein phosphatase [Nitrospira sp.]|nr:SpoIIE family protein phosphatase [bacterium]MBL7047956.1 SpoIIE family protein phosphatase [Nitrospira sp.]